MSRYFSLDEVFAHHCLLALRALLIAFGLALASSASAALPAGFSEQNIVRPDGNAWDAAVGVAFQNNGRTFVWERGGRVWIVDPASPVTQPMLDISPEVGAWADHGMLGFALHPNFDFNGYVYVLYIVDRHHLMNCDSSQEGPPVCNASYNPATDNYNSATVGRLTRYRAIKPAGDADYSHAVAIDYSSRKVLLGETRQTGCPILYSSHGVGSVVFGDDGTLLMSCGDGASYANADGGNDAGSYYVQALADGIIRPKENVGAFRAQLVDSLAGKILRLDPDTGDAVPSNPFYQPVAPRAARSRVWTLGLRNPYRFTKRPESGQHDPALAMPGVLYLGDVGWRVYEDLNVVHSGGLNFGWPLYEGMDPHPDYQPLTVVNQDAPNPLFGQAGCNQQFFQFKQLIQQDTLASPLSFPNPCNASQQVPSSINTFVHSRPVVDWKHAENFARWAAFNGNVAESPQIGQSNTQGTWTVQGTPFPGNTSTGGTWYTGTQFPASYRDTYFHGDYGAQWIRNFVFNSANFPVSVEPFNTNAGGVVAMAEHPTDGSLYYIAWASFVRKVTYSTGQNRPPLAVATSNVSFGGSPLTVQFTGDQSSDPDGGSITYSWDFGDGTPTSSAANPAHTYTASGTGAQAFTARLTVRDNLNATATATVVVSVNNTPPAATIVSPLDGSTYELGGQTVNLNLSASVSDAQSPSGQLTCQWIVFLHHNYNHTHEEPAINACAAQVQVTPLGCESEIYFYEARLTVRDPQGLTTQRNSFIYPNCPGNLAPVANTDNAQVQSGGTVQVNVLANDVDSDGLYPGSVRIVQGPARGSVSIDSTTGAATYVNNGASTTDDSFTYNVRDLLGKLSNTATVAVQVNAADTTAPTIPGGLSASAHGSSRVDLTWTASTDTGGSGLAGYRIYRNGGGTPVATVVGTTYSDYDRAASTPYSYVVTAIDVAGNESAVSNAANATTGAAGTWTGTDVGAVGLAGSQSQSGNGFTINASGADIWGTTDQFRFVYQRLMGDGEIRVRVTSLLNTAPWAKAGVMIRESLAANAKHAMAVVTPERGAVLQYRTATGGQSGPSGVTGTGAVPEWLRLVRAGSVLRAYQSEDGQSWTQIGQVTITMAGTPYIGLVLASLNNTTLNTATYAAANLVGTSGVGDVTAPSVPTGLQGSGASTTSVALTWNASTDTGGSGLAGYRVYRDGGATPIAQVTSGTSYTDTGRTPNTTYGYQVAAYDGAGNESARSTAVSVTTPAQAGWTGVNIGAVGIAGSHTQDGTNFTINASGADVWGTSDQFYFVYQRLTGDGELRVRVTSMLNTSPWAKAGLMIRDTLAANAKHAMAIVTPERGAVLQYRTTTGGSSAPSGVTGTGIVPEWLRLVRAGNTFTAYQSEDGTTWTQIGSISITMGTTPYVGLMLSSLNNSQLNTATYTGAQVGVPQSGGDQTPPSVPADLQSTGTTSTSISLSWSPSTDTGGSGLVGYRVYRDGGTTPVGQVSSTSFTNTGLEANTTYAYRVTAYDGDGNESGQSGPVQVTTAAGSISVPDVVGETQATAEGMIESAGLVVGTVTFQFSPTVPATRVISQSPAAGQGVAAGSAVNLVVSQGPSGGDGTPPSVPGSLTATARGSSRIDVTWSASTDTGGSGLAGYHVFRNGGGTPIATVTGTGYTDYNLAGGTTYTYQVSAFDGATNESSLSSTASATTAAAGTWTGANVGAVAIAGSHSQAGNSFTINASGADVWGTADQFYFVYQRLNGDGEIRVRVNSMLNTAPWAKAGVMIRDTLAANSKHAMAIVTPANGAVLQYRTATGGTSAPSGTTGTGAVPEWLRLVRAGNVFTAYQSEDGQAWTQIGQVTITMGASPFVGLMLSSLNNAQLNTATYSSASIVGATAGGADTSAPSVPQGVAGTGRLLTTLAAPASTALRPNPHSVIADDVDADGRADLIMAVAGDNSVALLRGLGGGTFAAPSYIPVGTKPKYAVTGDFNEDGRRDIVSADQDSASISVMLGNGNGTFQPRAVYPSCDGNHEVAVGDLNRDQNQDVVTACHRVPYTIAVFFGNGDGTFQPRVNLQGQSQVNSIAIADVNGDLFLDLLSTNNDVNTVSVLLGRGDGTFNPAANYPTAEGPHSVRAGDVNGDGRLDLVTANDRGSSMTVLIGNGNGTFQSGVSYATSTTSKSIALGDLDADGDLDAFVTNTTYPTCCTAAGSVISFLRNKGNGTFEPRVDYPSEPNGFGLLIRDLDGDGLLDVVTSNYHSAKFSILKGVRAPGVELTWNASTDTGGGVVAGYRVFRNGSLVGTVTSTRFFDTGLAPGTTYSYRVAAFDNASPANQSAQSAAINVTTPTAAGTVPNVVGQSQATAQATLVDSGYVVGSLSQANSNTVPEGDVISQSPTGGTAAPAGTAVSLVISLGPVSDTQPPSVPSGVTAVALGPTQVQISWSASTDAGGGTVAGYRVFREGVPIATTTGLSYTESGLAPEGHYHYTVAAFDDATPANESAQSSEAHVTTPAEPVGVPDVVGLTQTAAQSAIVAAGLVVGTVTQVNHPTVPAGRVVSQSPVASSQVPPGTPVDLVVSLGVAVDTAPPTVPGNVGASATGPTGVLVSWSASSDNGGGAVAGYHVLRDGQQVATVGSASTNYSDTGLSPSTTYSYRVVAFDNAVPANSSAASAAVQVTTDAVALRINAGGGTFTDGQGRAWSADSGFDSGATFRNNKKVSGTDDWQLYRDAHVAAAGSPMRYAAAVPNGRYAVTLMFAEISPDHQSTGARSFTVRVEGASFLSGFDIFGQGGGGFVAVDRSVTVTVTDGQLTVDFVPGAAGVPMVNAIEVVSVPSP